MDCIEGVDPLNLLKIKSEISEDLETLDLPAQFNALYDKPSKCGDIFAFNEGRYLFCCSFCENNFDKIGNFIKHVEEGHLKSVEDNNSLPQAEKPSPELDESQIRDYKGAAIEHEVKEEYIDVPFDDKWEPKFANEDSELEKSETNEKIETIVEIKRQNSNLECEFRGEKHHSDSDLRVHKNKSHLVEYVYSKSALKKILKCNYCDRTFQQNSKLVAHERMHTGEAPFQCPTCMKCFSNSWRCKQHQLLHTGERPHKCNHCPSAFSNKSNLLSHLRIHSRDKRFKCDQCGKCFHTNTHRIIHIRSHTGERPFQCEECGVRLITASALSFHKKQRHLKSKDFACQTCGKRFITGSCLRKHMVVHSDDRPFKCSICSATFRHKKAFTAHSKIHSDVKEYVCKICGKEFAQGPGLYSHMKSHDINKTFRKSRQVET